jgi:hypothetical protein
MKKNFVAVLALLAIVSCNQEEPVGATGNVSFAVSGSVPDTGSQSPEKLVVSVEDVNGKTIFDNKVVDLVQTDGGYSTEAFQLDDGEYRITKYLVISGTEAAYATPRAGAQKASLVDRPLPFQFTVVASHESRVTPKIVGISPQDLPQNFGYGDFGYDTPGSETQEWIKIRVQLEITVGEIYYPNLDAAFTVHAFDDTNTEVWTQDYDYVGPESNDLKIRTGYDHYTVEARKWGQTLQHVYSHPTLFEIRVREGEIPVVQVFQAKVQPKRVSSTVSSWTRVVNGQTVTEPTARTDYEYTAGRISGMKTYVWSAEDKSFIAQTNSEFVYDNNLLQKIVTRNAGDLSGHVDDIYTYDSDGKVSHIQHLPSGGNVASDVDLSYFGSGGSVRAVYKFSNGAGFEYDVHNEFGSSRSDKTTRFGELCSTGNYTYDKNVNPLAHLGYIDYLFRNYSFSNRLTEDVDYVGCAFPSLVAESYSYVYDKDEYPVRQETNYRGTELKTIVEYSYVE